MTILTCFVNQVLSDILVDRINYRVMTSVYADIKGGWTMKQKIREQVGLDQLELNYFAVTMQINVN